MNKPMLGGVKRARVYCLDCGTKFDNDFNGRQVCPDCKVKILDTVVVYDRDSGRGTVPANLQRQYGKELA